MNDTEPPRSVDADGVRRYWVLLICMVAGLTAIGLVLSGVFKARTYYNTRTGIASALKQIAVGVYSFNDQYKHLPPAIGQNDGKRGTVHFHLLPFLEQQEVYNQNRVDVAVSAYSWADPTWRGSKVFEGKYGTTSIAANWLALTGGPEKEGKITFQDSFLDGISETILFTLRYQMCNRTPTLWGYDTPDAKAPFIGLFNKKVFQAKPTQSECDPTRANFWSDYIQLVMTDSSVHSVSSHIGPRTWELLMHPADGEKAPAWDN